MLGTSPLQLNITPSNNKACGTGVESASASPPKQAAVGPLKGYPNGPPGGGTGGVYPLLGNDRTIETTACQNVPGYFEDEQSGKRVIGSCKSWNCPPCAEKNKRRLRSRVFRALVLWRGFWTFTLRLGDPHNADDVWHRMEMSVRKKYPHRFFKTKQFQENGMRHFHALFDKRIPHKVVRDAWILASGGISNNVNVKPVHDQRQAAQYMTKYMSNDLTSNHYLKGEHRYSSTRGTLPPPPPPSGHWTFTLCRGITEEALLLLDTWFVRKWKKGPPNIEDAMLELNHRRCMEYVALEEERTI